MTNTTKVTIRWFDGYLEEFECSEVRFGGQLIFMRLVDGDNRHIPLLTGVRWFRVSPESHALKDCCGEHTMTLDEYVDAVSDKANIDDIYTNYTDHLGNFRISSTKKVD